MTYFDDTIGRWGKGNIDLNNRIVVYHDGEYSTELSISVGYDDKVYLIPTVCAGEILSMEDAIAYFEDTGEYLGIFDTDAEADDYAERLHLRQEWYYSQERTERPIMRRYKYTMGFQINGTNVPDPSEFSYQIGDLDTSGSRDATGLLHRAYVATKINFEISWNSLDWAMLQQILGMINSPQFTFTAIDPRTFNGTYTGTYYVGDRTGKAHYYLQEKADIAQFSLKVKFIEY